MEHHAGGIQLEGCIGDDACIVPALTLGVVHQEHMVGGDLAEAHLGGIDGLLLGGGGSGDLDIQHGKNSPSFEFVI